MTLGIMQPYFLPHIGYWQLLAAVDRFILYDNIQYTKQGWMNRNRFLRNGTDAYFTVPLKHGSAVLDVAQRELVDDFAPRSLLNPLAAAYQRAPFFDETFPLVERVIAAAHRNLFEYLRHGIVAVGAHLGIRTPIIVSSTVPIDHGLKAQPKVLALCDAMGATRYINTVGGRQLYSPTNFAERGIELRFLQPRTVPYRQFGDHFVDNLSIVDVLMFNSRNAVRRMLSEYELS